LTTPELVPESLEGSVTFHLPAGLVGGCKEPFVVIEDTPKLGCSHVDDIFGYGQVNDLLKALSGRSCVDVKGSKRSQVGLDIALVSELPELDECRCRFPWVVVFLLDSGLVVCLGVDFPDGAAAMLVPFFSFVG